MKDTLQKRCRQLVENNDALRKAFKLEYGVLLILCAVIIGLRPIDVEKIKECKQIIKKKTSLFSSFRSTSFLALATLLSLEDDPESKMDDIINTYSIFKENKFKDSDYLAISAFMIKDTDRSEKEKWIQKARDIYTLIKAKHPVITSSDDYGYTVMLALSARSAEAAVVEKDRCYEFLKDQFRSKDAVQALSFVLALGGESPEIKCERALRLFDELKKKGYKPGTEFELPGLGALTLAAKNESQTISDLIEVSDFLKTKKGFGALSIEKTQRLLYAAALVVQENGGDDDSLNLTLTTTVTNILLAIQMTMIIAASAASVVVASSTPSS